MKNLLKAVELQRQYAKLVERFNEADEDIYVYFITPQNVKFLTGIEKFAQQHGIKLQTIGAHKNYKSAKYFEIDGIVFIQEEEWD